MSKSDTPNDWDKLWYDYNKALKTWMGSFESLQRATDDVQSKYREAMTKAVKESNEKTINQLIDSWKKAMTDAGINVFKQFGDDWQKVLSQSSMNQVRTYGEAMSKFAEVWQKMWKR